jgi:pSer/pThr/pTyr-binding forkhead associated (FHA) protein
LVVRDLGSTNGSFVQGSRFNELTLGFGAEVTIGKTVLKYLPTEEEVDPTPSDKESYGSLVGRDAKLRRLFRAITLQRILDERLILMQRKGRPFAMRGITAKL